MKAGNLERLIGGEFGRFVFFGHRIMAGPGHFFLFFLGVSVGWLFWGLHS